jgi:hypothetical protein
VKFLVLADVVGVEPVGAGPVESLLLLEHAAMPMPHAAPNAIKTKASEKR